MGNIFEKKTFNWIVIVFCVQFFCLNILLGDFSGINDGITRIGFPFVFFQDTGGKCENCENLKWFCKYPIFPTARIGLFYFLFEKSINSILSSIASS